MRGSVVYQVNTVFETIKAFGHSKHADKEAIRQEFAQQGITNTWHNLGKELKIYSYATADQYRSVWKELLNQTKENFNIKDIEKLTSEHIQSYLESKIADGVKYSTFQKYVAAIEKLEVALNTYAQQKNTSNTYSFDIKDIKAQAQEVLERSHVTRAYDNPKALIEAISDKTFKTIAQAQLEGGFRISELNYISQKNFLENNTYLVISGKGGLDRQVPLPQDVYNSLKELVKDNQKFIFDMDKYRNTLKDAAAKTNQDYTGSHGLRWNYAQNKFMDFQKQGYGFEESLSKVSELLGHHRADITKHYLQS
jgi:integrase